ncbi:hypothetical protein SDJN03_04596, partial [Cucurbita argyrosperma subsp. sororia]
MVGGELEATHPLGGGCLVADNGTGSRLLYSTVWAILRPISYPGPNTNSGPWESDGALHPSLLFVFFLLFLSSSVEPSRRAVLCSAATARLPTAFFHNSSSLRSINHGWRSRIVCCSTDHWQCLMLQMWNSHGTKCCQYVRQMLVF